MQTIVTRYLAPTDTRGSRIKVMSVWGSKIYSYDNMAECAHRAAFELFLAERNKIMAAKHPDCQQAVEGGWYKLVAHAGSLDNRGFTYIIK